MIPKKITIKNGKTGEVLAETSPGARIFSIEDTQTLFRLAQTATDKDSTIALGKAVLKMIKAQNNRPVQYTKS